MDPGRSDYSVDRISSSHAQTYQENVPQDMRIMLPFQTESMYKCGSCSSMFHMVWQLHEHVLLHTTGGWYTYNHNIRTAFPKFAGICQEIQTDAYKDISDNKNVELVCNSTQTEDDLYSYFTGRDEGHGDSAELRDSAGDIVKPGDSVKSDDSAELQAVDYSANVEVKIEKLENEIVDDFGDTTDVNEDCYDGDTDEDVNYLPIEESYSDVNDPDLDVVEQKVKRTKRSTRSEPSENDSKKKYKSNTSARKKLKTVKGLYKSKSKSGSSAVTKPLIKCKFCDKKFRTNLHMRRHCIQDHPTEKNFPCINCDESFVTKAEAVKHRRVHNKEKYCCEFCNKVLASAQNFHDHLTMHTGEKTYECKDCGNYFRSKRQLNVHERREHNPNYDHMCENCGRVFKSRENLRSHINSCLDIRPFACTICGKSYPRKSYLNVHMRKHTGEKPFVCHTCGMKFSRSNVLTQHMLVHGERKFTCELCGQKFKAPTGLRDHERIHQQDKRFTCQYCGKAFVKKCNMETHLRQHTGETPYKCNICGQAYKQNVLLKTHMQSHKADALPASQHPQTTDGYKPELVNPPTAASNLFWS